MSRLRARTIAELGQGEIRELQGTPHPPGEVPPLRADREHYLRVIAEKTASLIATSTRLGAMLGGLPQTDVDALGDYGFALGMAFQLSDDILDIEGDETYFGKTPGTDLREGVATLPVLYALESDDPAGARLRELVSRPITDDAEVGEALTLLRASPAMDHARATLRGYADDARALLPAMPDVPARTALAALVELVVLRSG